MAQEANNAKISLINKTFIIILTPPKRYNNLTLFIIPNVSSVNLLQNRDRESNLKFHSSLFSSTLGHLETCP
ncbi:hypothetical protein BOSEA31B_13786 [Hyphomicrobiales bacterium]|nr:hypothetical protein BOSEA31B_13786 [Hyphomicrobiales bacterium]CAH1699556.1 hypothetical protein BOSEA1005_12609 [Hyphomicrobiales bacterium]CAI0343344.1 hypothetical protein BO1005MUT1_220143 [Hyphomicrobiales bacterium]